MKFTKTKVGMLIVGSGLLVVSSAQSAHAFDLSVINWAIEELCGHLMGHLGGLLASVATVGAIVAAAMGSYRAFYGAIMTAIGAFTTSTIMGIYFPEAASLCENAADTSSLSSSSNSSGGGDSGGGGSAPQSEVNSNSDFQDLLTAP